MILVNPPRAFLFPHFVGFFWFCVCLVCLVKNEGITPSLYFFSADFFYIKGISFSIPVRWLTQSKRMGKLVLYAFQIYLPQFFHLAVFNRNLANRCKNYLICGQMKFDQLKLLIESRQLSLLSGQGHHSCCLTGFPTAVSRERLLVFLKISEQKVSSCCIHRKLTVHPSGMTGFLLFKGMTIADIHLR